MHFSCYYHRSIFSLVAFIATYQTLESRMGDFTPAEKPLQDSSDPRRHHRRIDPRNMCASYNEIYHPSNETNHILYQDWVEWDWSDMPEHGRKIFKFQVAGVGGETRGEILASFSSSKQDIGTTQGNTGGTTK